MDDFAITFEAEFKERIGPFAAEIFGSDRFVESPVEVSSFGAEKGSQKHRTHFNIVIRLRHAIPLYSVKKLNERMKAFLDRELSEFINGGRWALYGKLVGGYGHNYAIKDERWGMNMDFLEDHGNDAEVLRLSTDGAVMETVNEYKNARYFTWKRVVGNQAAVFRDPQGNPSKIRLYNAGGNRVVIEPGGDLDL